MKLPDFSSLGPLELIYESQRYMGLMLPRPLVEVFQGQFCMNYLIVNKERKRVEFLCPTELSVVGTINSFEQAWDEINGPMDKIMGQIKGNDNGPAVH